MMVRKKNSGGCGRRKTGSLAGKSQNTNTTGKEKDRQYRQYLRSLPEIKALVPFLQPLPLPTPLRGEDSITRGVHQVTLSDSLLSRATSGALLEELDARGFSILHWPDDTLAAIRPRKVNGSRPDMIALHPVDLVHIYSCARRARERFAHGGGADG